MKDRSSPARSRLRLSSTTARGVPPQSSKPPKKVCYPYSVHNVRIVLLASVSGVSFCQGPEVAKQLLQEVADSAAHATSWRIEGSVKYRGSRPEDTHTSSFAHTYTRWNDPALNGRLAVLRGRAGQIGSEHFIDRVEPEHST